MNVSGSDRTDVQSSFSERIEQLFQQLEKKKAEIDSLTEQIQRLQGSGITAINRPTMKPFIQRDLKNVGFA
jgi:hypothetical protein